MLTLFGQYSDRSNHQASYYTAFLELVQIYMRFAFLFGSTEHIHRIWTSPHHETDRTFLFASAYDHRGETTSGYTHNKKKKRFVAVHIILQF